MMDLEFSFRAELWAHSGGGWHFLTLPRRIAKEIRLHSKGHFGFGSIRVKARIGDTEWKTSIFPDRKADSFLLPVKASVRKKEAIEAGDQVKTRITVDL